MAEEKDNEDEDEKEEKDDDETTTTMDVTQVGTKVVAPIDNDKWITLAALNRLRRTDPSKVEPMWFNQWAIWRVGLMPNRNLVCCNMLALEDSC